MHIYCFTCSNFKCNDAQNLYYPSYIHNKRHWTITFCPTITIRYCGMQHFKFWISTYIGLPTDQVWCYYCAKCEWQHWLQHNSYNTVNGNIFACFLELNEPMKINFSTFKWCSILQHFLFNKKREKNHGFTIFYSGFQKTYEN